MKFTVQKESFTKLVAIVGERTQSQNSDAILLLSAHESRVDVNQGDTEAETEAVVWEEGQCTVSRAKLVQVLAATPDDASVTMEVRRNSLQIGGARVPLISYNPSAVRPQRFQIFLASDSGLVPAVPLMEPSFGF